MKANEMPERIYLFDYNDAMVTPLEGDTTYVRENAFIEKAVGYLNSKLYDWVQTTNPNQRSCANTIMKQDFIEDFRKYMEE